MVMVCSQILLKQAVLLSAQRSLTPQCDHSSNFRLGRPPSLCLSLFDAESARWAILINAGGYRSFPVVSKNSVGSCTELMGGVPRLPIKSSENTTRPTCGGIQPLWPTDIRAMRTLRAAAAAAAVSSQQRVERSECCERLFPLIRPASVLLSSLSSSPSNSKQF